MTHQSGGGTTYSQVTLTVNKGAITAVSTYGDGPIPDGGTANFFVVTDT